MPYPPTLSDVDKRALANALLDCDCMKSPASRDQVIDQLPADIRRKVNRFQNDRQGVMSIIDACLSHGEGIECLMGFVKFYEGKDSIPWKNLIRVKEAISARLQTPFIELGEKLAELSRAPQDPANAPALIDDLRKRIEEARRTGSGYLDEVMHEIDYTEVQEFLETEERRYAEEGFAALCLIQNSSALGGDWCLKRIKGWLQKKKGPTPNEVIISPSEGETTDALFILKRLAAKFVGEHPAGDITAYTQSIVQRICGSIYLGGRLLIVIRQWEDFTDQEATLYWLLKDFWRPLVGAFRQSENRARAKLLVVVMTDLEIDVRDAADLCCGPADFDCEKIVRLQLRRWHKQELRNWLIDHWAERLSLNIMRVNALAEVMYAASLNGNPEHVYNQARKRLVKETV